jgi:hypothetical protein
MSRIILRAVSSALPVSAESASPAVTLLLPFISSAMNITAAMTAKSKKPKLYLAALFFTEAPPCTAVQTISVCEDM